MGLGLFSQKWMHQITVNLFIYIDINNVSLLQATDCQQENMAKDFNCSEEQMAG